MSVALFTLHQQNTHPCGLHDKQSEEDPAHDNFTLHLRVDHFKVFRKLVGGGERGKTLRRRKREDIEEERERRRETRGGGRGERKTTMYVDLPSIALLGLLSVLRRS